MTRAEIRIELPESGWIREILTDYPDAVFRVLSVVEDKEIGFSVRYMGNPKLDETLTEKQRALVEKAVKMGYYDTPRRCSLTELAEECGIAKSTCSDTLHRAEERVLKEFVNGFD
ncbi:MAG: helix-turn-helix domain-containing protein [Halobacteriales archaeon]|nr:helix-turn-helix domain-containing protein [Halobacteriales archaeon]